MEDVSPVARVEEERRQDNMAKMSLIWVIASFLVMCLSVFRGLDGAYDFEQYYDISGLDRFWIFVSYAIFPFSIAMLNMTIATLARAYFQRYSRLRRPQR